MKIKNKKQEAFEGGERQSKLHRDLLLEGGERSFFLC